MWKSNQKDADGQVVSEADAKAAAESAVLDALNMLEVASEGSGS